MIPNKPIQEFQSQSADFQNIMKHISVVYLHMWTEQPLSISYLSKFH